MHVFLAGASGATLTIAPTPSRCWVRYPTIWSLNQRRESRRHAIFPLIQPLVLVPMTDYSACFSAYSQLQLPPILLALQCTCIQKIYATHPPLSFSWNLKNTVSRPCRGSQNTGGLSSLNTFSFISPIFKPAGSGTVSLAEGRAIGDGR